MSDLLKVVAREGADELLLEPGRPPRMALEGKWRVMDAMAFDSDDVAELFQAMASEDQRREFEQCGDIQFVFVDQHRQRFSVAAKMRQGELLVRVKNLER